MKYLSLWNDMDRGLFRDFDRLHDQMNLLFNDYGRHLARAENVLPACDIQESDGHFLLSLDFPGVKKEDLDIQIEGNRLTVSGERKRETRSEDEGSSRFERTYGKFQRTFTLPTSVDSDKIEAQFENGVLSLVIPKAEEAKAKRVKIHEGRTGLFDRVFGKKPELKEATKSA